MSTADTIREFAPAKVNLYLEVAGKRRDGFHEIITVMETISVGDQVLVEPAKKLKVSANRRDVPGGEKNLAYAIVRYAEEELGRELPARIRIEKTIPPGTGLGGGSSDAVAALRGVLALHEIEVDRAVQRRIAERVGSDVAFFVEGGLALCLGRGERISALSAPGSRHYVIALGAPAAPTAEVYAKVRAQYPGEAPMAPLLKSLMTEGLVDAEAQFNRLEEPAVEVVPDLARFRKNLGSATSEKPLLSGSGSAFFFALPTAEAAREVHEKLEKTKGVDAHLATSWPPPDPGAAG